MLSYTHQGCQQNTESQVTYQRHMSNYKHVMLKHYGEMYILIDKFYGVQFLLAAQSLYFQV